MSEEQRKLTPAELKRKEKFDAVCEAMSQSGYEKHDLTIGVVKANIMAFLVMLPFVVILYVLNIIVNINKNFELGRMPLLLFLVLFFILVVIHEVIHGLTWSVFAKNHMNSINFGVIWSALTPYCTCSEPMGKWQYTIGCAMPTLILGFGFAIVAIIFNQQQLMTMSLVMILSGGGDFYIILKILLHKSSKKDIVYCDHPYECGVVVFEK